MPDEPSDEECKAIAMLTGYYFQERFRYEGKKFLQKPKPGQGRMSQRYIEYLDPVTLEVIGTSSLADHYEQLNRSYSK